MTEEEMKLEMQKPIIVAATGLEWFLLLSFVDMAMTKDEMFSSEEDRNNLSILAKRLHDQAFPMAEDNVQGLAKVLEIKPKKLIVKPDLILS